MRVNMLVPGPINAALPCRSIDVPAKAVEQVKIMLANELPMMRMGRPEEAATVVLFLASALASFITGIEILVDGSIHAIQ